MTAASDVDSAVETLRDTLDVLERLVDWHLTRHKWEQVERLVGIISTALTQGDFDKLGSALDQPALAGPGRATRIGAAPGVPAPPPLRAMADRLMPKLAAAVQRQASSGLIGSSQS